MANEDNIYIPRMDSMEKKIPINKEMPIVHQLVERMGFKPATKKVYAYTRILLVVAVILMLIVFIVKDRKKPAKNTITTLEEMSYIIKPGTKMYEMISEMDPVARSKYLTGLKCSVGSACEDSSFLYKYLQAMGASIMAALLSEHIINANVSKPVGTMGKTIFYSTIYGLITLL